jgi:sulfur carrier protein
VKVTINGTEEELAGGATVRDIVSKFRGDQAGRGIAVAVNGEVVPRGVWEKSSLSEGDRVEVLGATQGG